MADLNVNQADLLRAADDYTELAARAAAISPQAVAEVTRIIETHGPMGYPVAVGIVAGLAPREAQVAAKIVDFGQYAQRLTEHAAIYQRTDADGASRMASHFQEPAATSVHMAGNRVTVPDWITVFCVPTQVPVGFQCTHLFPDGSILIGFSKIDISGGWPQQ